VVVIAAGASPRGLTEDYLDVALDPGGPARATRFDATLVARGEGLAARARVAVPS
jgi:hypothetical protein